ncbi:MAG: class I SAM-dependent methyltransferase [Planctomycetales bacterium]|nr:class I SAM-dependent methyltransferase [Planctomycetales bacterium]
MNSYDELPYDSHPYDRTHPDHLAAVGTLFGMTPPDAARCRVLELGCASGGNLIPQAVAAPESRFVGIDLSQRQLESGWELIRQLELDNIELRHQNILEFPEDDGPFDYIICHGVYSWVPPEVQQRILEICARQLTENGLAYISYNTNPGWFLRGMVRQMMCYHARQFDSPQKKVEQARALLDFLIGAGPAGDPTYHSLLTRELEIVRNRADSYLYHEHLEEENSPVFFHEFVERSQQAGLKYVGETQLSEMVPGNFSKQAEETLKELGVGLVQAEQYLDFLRNRTFRRSLLCRESVALDRNLHFGKLQGLHVGSNLRPQGPIGDIGHHGDEQFSSPDGRQVRVGHSLVKAALVELSERWPGTVCYDELASLADVRRAGGPVMRSAAGLEQERQELGSTIIELYANDLVELRSQPPRYQTELSSHPFASPLARIQIAAGSDALVTNLRHQMLQLSESQSQLIRLLDGTHDRRALLLAFRELLASGTLVVDNGGKTVDGIEDELLEQLIEHDLSLLSEKALLLR